MQGSAGSNQTQRNRRKSSSRQFSTQTPPNSPSNRALQPVLKLLGLAILAITLNVFRHFPELGYLLIGIGIAYLCLLFFFPYLWLIVLPIATVTVDLSTYSGRFLFNEYDLLFLVTIAFGLLSNKYRISIFKFSWPVCLIGCFLLVVFSSFSAWSVFLSPPTVSTSNPYYLPEYGYKLVKGMLWGLMLVPLWLRLLNKHRDRAINQLVVGQCVAAIIFGFVILWERGTLGVILSGDPWYHIVSSLLDLSSSYRTTGLFADMHTGGEVVDGIILLLLPMTLYGVFCGSNRGIRMLGLTAFASLAYCTMVGFTRATYVSFFLSIVAFVVLYFITQKREEVLKKDIPYSLFGVTIVAAFSGAYVAFSLAGSYGLASFAGLAALAYMGGWLLKLPRGLALGLLLLGGIVCLYLAVDSHFSSRWVEGSRATAISLVAALTLFYVLANLLFVRISGFSEFNKFLLVAVMIMVPVGFSFAVGSYKFNERMETVGKDLGSRTRHWARVIESSNPKLSTQLLGNGVGSFPGNYVYHFPDTVRDVGSYVIKQDSDSSYLSIGPGHDLAFGQRVSVEANTDYQITFRLKAEMQGKIAFFLCERNLIFASNFMANCKSRSLKFKPTAGIFETFSLSLNSGKVGQKNSLSRWPTTLYLKNFSKEGMIDLDAISLKSDDIEILANNHFIAGGDNWFFYNDFSHLPWHIKNTYLQSWYHYGYIGLLLFLGLALSTVAVAVKKQDNSALYVAFASGVIAIGIFGVFGSPLDSSRVSWIFYFYMFSVLLRPTAGVVAAVNPRQRTVQTRVL